MKVTAMRGLPGSGKSTKARQIASETGAVVVSRDDLRKAFYGTYTGLTQDDENFITAVENAAIERALDAGKDVVVDAMHLKKRYLDRVYALAVKNGAGFEVCAVTATLEECIAGNRGRDEKAVPEDVIRSLHQKFGKNIDKPYTGVANAAPLNLEKVVRDDSLPSALIVDMDGTLAIHNGRSPYDYDSLLSDLPNRVVVDIVTVFKELGYKIIAVSGRPDSHKDLTVSWWREHLPYEFDALFMRATGDRRRDDLVKLELFNEHIRGVYDVEFVMDDRNRVVKMWRNLGLTCLQVADGDF